MTELEYPKDFDFEAAYKRLCVDFCRLQDFCWEETFRADAADKKIERLETIARIAATQLAYGFTGEYENVQKALDSLLKRADEFMEAAALVVRNAE